MIKYTSLIEINRCILFIGLISYKIYNNLEFRLTTGYQLSNLAIIEDNGNKYGLKYSRIY